MSERAENLRNNPLLDTKTVKVVERILSKNDQEANRLREVWKRYPGLYVVNLMSSPGAGKTTLLEHIASEAKFTFGVIEGDLETNRDAERLEKVGVRAHQITTGMACHLEAHMISRALESFSLEGLDYLFIENVGNLVCPASYDLGAHLNLALLSVPEGDDKVLKYPSMFRAADAVLLTKTDLAEHFDYDVNRIITDMGRLKPEAETLRISSKKPDDIRQVVQFLESKKSGGFVSDHIFI